MNIPAITGDKPSFLIKNDNEEVFQVVMENIKKVYKIDEEVNKEFCYLKEEDHLLTKNGPYKKGKAIKM